MKRLVPAFGVPLILASGLTQGDTRLPVLSPAASGYGPASSSDPLPGTLSQALQKRLNDLQRRKTPEALSLDDQVQALQKRLNDLQLRKTPQAPLGRRPGDSIPHTYLVYGLRTGPGGMAFTDRSGAVIPVPSNPQIILKPFNGYPAVPPPSVAPPVIVRP